ncbi:putative DNA-binding domain-containing protein [Chitinophaga pendula]|uniref:HvfC/BufC N-terminal domain-containing protein n=1 Tax=Chitinophaga TaxID=79328 RepID=UPI000BAEBC5E|nr:MULTISPECIES: putative DNA-binding domain-containing protein [Chitinophaga]ASZ11815.1 DUF2063 domain-containing protein [Chitinophaga sp. MD30]UCJ05164.1 putative DNA-binding domain-containing protein [Chitinophaga pendula]
MLLRDHTKQQQSSLATYCRTGEYSAIPGVREQHVHHYRRLVYNVVDDSLQSSYPLTFQLLETEEWDELVQAFFSEHGCQSPQVWYMPREFYEWYQGYDSPLHRQYPFLSELLLFEWLEVELYMMEDIPAVFKAGDLGSEALVINPEHHLQYFTYPVHLKQAATITAEDEGHYFLCLHRHPESGEILFNDLSPAFVHMLESLASAPMEQAGLISRTCELLQIPANEDIKQATAAFFAQAAAQRLILGVAQ